MQLRLDGFLKQGRAKTFQESLGVARRHRRPPVGPVRAADLPFQDFTATSNGKWTSKGK